MVKDEAPNWFDNLLRGAPAPKPPDLGSERIKDLVGRGLLTPRQLSLTEIQELSAAVISHLVEKRS